VGGKVCTNEAHGGMGLVKLLEKKGLVGGLWDIGTVEVEFGGGRGGCNS